MFLVKVVKYPKSSRKIEELARVLRKEIEDVELLDKGLGHIISLKELLSGPNSN